MKDQEFHDKVNEMFESKLKKHTIRIMDIEKEKILSEGEMNYDRVLFDADLNIYKLVDGKPVRVDNDNFKALLI